MTASAGYPALLKLGSNTVGEIKKIDFGLDVDQYDTTKMTGFGGSNARTFIPGLYKATCKSDGNLDMTDTNGQLAIFNGAKSGAKFTAHCMTGVTSTSSFDVDCYVKNFSGAFDVAAENKVSFELQPTGDVGYTP